MKSSSRAMAKSGAMTPMMQQYLRIKAEHNDPHTILFFRLGDFYEMFYEDAVVAAKLLDITLTTRNKNDPNPVPLCGIPYHAADGYIARLIQAGKKVAICEQVEDPKAAKGVVKREVLRVVTPGAVMAPESLISNEHNFLAAIYEQDGRYGLAVIDISTGNFRATELSSQKALRDELERLEVREVLLPAGEKLPGGPSTERLLITHLPPNEFAAERAPTIEGKDAIVTNAPLAIPAVAAVWHYLHYTKLAGPELAQHIQTLHWYQTTDHLVIDEVTKRNLELSRTMTEGQRYGSLLWHLDRTETAMGMRRLREWLFYPLQSCEAINTRYDAVQIFVDDMAMQQACGEALTPVADMERIAGRLTTEQGNARDLMALHGSLGAVPQLITALQKADGRLGEIAALLDPCADLTQDIQETLVDEPPVVLTEGRLIRESVDAQLDEFRTIQREGKGFIARLELEERKRTGISTLKVRYNRVFGYYIEVTHMHKDKVPEHYIRKQTLTNAERYITPELKAYEEKVLSAQDKLTAIEYDLFVQLRRRVVAHVGRIKTNAQLIAEADVFLSLARVAQEGNYCRPQLVEESLLNITEGRHPVVERLLQGDRFVPNDCALDARGDGDAKRLLIITGPNMAGKSTIMRQVGLITLMAHMGSFVPATSATIGLTDRIFTRVGASDNMARGQSTFMVEMAEATTILQEATERSLILIDELGRGTSTYDGISIAWAVAEYLNQHIKGKTLFATHYHELAALAGESSTIGNVTMSVKEWNDEIIFLRTLVPGAANRSYGIQVAKLAGLPTQVTTRAQEILADLETETLRETHDAKTTNQMNLFGQENPRAEAVADKLQAIDPDAVTPRQALDILSDCVRAVKGS